MACSDCGQVRYINRGERRSHFRERCEECGGPMNMPSHVTEELKTPKPDLQPKPPKKRRKKMKPQVLDGGEWVAIGNETIPKDWPNFEAIVKAKTGRHIPKQKTQLKLKPATEKTAPKKPVRKKNGPIRRKVDRYSMDETHWNMVLSCGHTLRVARYGYHTPPATKRCRKCEYDRSGKTTI